MSKVTAILKLPDKVGDLIVRASEIHDAMAAASWFTGLATKLTALQTAISDLTTAQSAVRNGGPEATSIRDEKLNVVNVSLEHLCADVQGIADSHTGQEEEIILSAGMFIKGKSGGRVPKFKAGSELSGTVKMYAPAPNTSKGFAFAWFMSTDGTTWTYVTSTPVSEVTINNLTPNTLYHFTYKLTIGKNPAGDFVEPVTCRVK